jgi:hypothetical protein
MIMNVKRKPCHTPQLTIYKWSGIAIDVQKKTNIILNSIQALMTKIHHFKYQ